jgi:hypothetical protein
MRSEEYAKKSLFDATISSQHSTINQILTNSTCKGKPVYIPPKYFSNPETIRIFVAKQENESFPSSEFAQIDETQFFLTNPDGMLLNPPGIGLVKLFEKTLKTKFTQVDLKFLQNKLPQLLTEDLEICENFEMDLKGNRVHVKIINSLMKVNEDAFSPLTSAIACIIAKTTGQQTSVEDIQINRNGKDLSIEYQILSEA